MSDDPPVSHTDLRALFEFLVGERARYRCDHQGFTLTRQFLAKRKLSEDDMLRWLKENGAGCDCRVCSIWQQWGERFGFGVDGFISYQNTDLDLTSVDDPAVLAAAFEVAGVRPLHITRGGDGLWYAIFETDERHTEPEPDIAAMLAVVEGLSPPLRSAWAGCSQREFNIGYLCGLEPWAYHQGLSADLLGRMAAAGASLRVTLYPDRESVSTSTPTS